MADNDENVVLERRPAERQTSVGTVLRSAREAQQLSVEQLAAELRIEPQHLVALEQDRFDAIGVPVFAKGYLKQYGLRLGLDTSELLDRYREQVEDDEIHLVARRPIQMPDARPFGFWLLAVLLVLLVAGFVVFFVLGRPVPTLGRLQEPEVAGAAASVASLRTVGTASSVAVAQPSRQPEVEPTFTEVPTIASTSRLPAAAALTPATMMESSLPETEPAPAIEITDPSEPTGATRSSALDGLAEAHIELALAAECWVEAVDATGTQNYYGLGAAGAEIAFTAILPLELLLGDVEAVTLRVDGRAQPVPKPRRGNRIRFTLNPNE